jgi:GR25 family glycosyltransferase involved in LPS biosynthesis
MEQIHYFSDILHIFYINLESRTDRKEHVMDELHKIGLGPKAVRFNAIKLKNGTGAVGCSMSHLKCLETAKANNWPHVLICEDDIMFLDPSLFITQMNKFFSKNMSWDVLLLAGNNMLPYSAVDNTCIQVGHCLTTTGYIVQNHYFDTLIKNYKEGIVQLMKNPEDKKTYAIDKYWIRLQQADKWFLIIPLSVIQREDYSDIEGKVTNFQKNMLNYNKAYSLHL